MSMISFEMSGGKKPPGKISKKAKAEIDHIHTMIANADEMSIKEYGTFNKASLFGLIEGYGDLRESLRTITGLAEKAMENK